MKFAPPLHHTIKSSAILRNSIDIRNILITFALYQQTADFQSIPITPEIAVFKYCPGHTESRKQYQLLADSFLSLLYREYLDNRKNKKATVSDRFLVVDRGLARFASLQTSRLGKANPFALPSLLGLFDPGFSSPLVCPLIRPANKKATVSDRFLVVDRGFEPLCHA